MNIFLNKKKFEILTLFKLFFNCIEHNMNKYIRICINNKIEYFNENFIKYIIKRNIRFEFIIVDNSQINNYVECFNQIFMRKINIFFKNNNFVVK